LKKFQIKKNQKKLPWKFPRVEEKSLLVVFTFQGKISLFPNNIADESERSCLYGYLINISENIAVQSYHKNFPPQGFSNNPSKILIFDIFKLVVTEQR